MSSISFVFGFGEEGGDSRAGAEATDVPALPPSALEFVSLDDDRAASPPAAALVRAGEYEGGGTVWESTALLLAVLRARPALLDGAAAVADLGCGTGLLAREALARPRARLRALLLTDLNADVLRGAAAPALRADLARLGAAATLPDVALIAGSWDALLAGARGGAGAGAPAPLRGGGIDLLLSSETLYRPAQLPALCDLIRALLRPPVASGGAAGGGALGASASGSDAARGGLAADDDLSCDGATGGLALLATKRYYYGAELGGGTSAFLAAAAVRGLRAIVIETREDGRSMTLDVIAVRRAV